MARRGLIVKLLTGLKQICNHPAQYLKEADDARLTGRSGKLELLDELLDTIVAEDGAVLVFTQYVAMARLLERHLADRGIGTQLLHGGTPVAPARGDGRAVPGRRGAGVPAVAEGGRDRAQPDPRRPRRALRPLVEPGRRGPGHRPGVPDRPDPAGAGAPADRRGHHRGPDRRDAQQPNASSPTRCSPAARRPSPSSPTPNWPTWSSCEVACDDRGARVPGVPGAAARSTRGRSWWGSAWVQALEDTSLDSGPAAEGPPVRELRAGRHDHRQPRPDRRDGLRRPTTPTTPSSTSTQLSDDDVEPVPRPGRRAGRAHRRAARRRDAARPGRGRRRRRACRCCPASATSTPSCTCDGWELPCQHAAAPLLPGRLAARRRPVRPAAAPRPLPRRPPRPTPSPEPVRPSAETATHRMRRACSLGDVLDGTGPCAARRAGPSGEGHPRRAGGQRDRAAARLRRPRLSRCSCSTRPAGRERS